MEFVDTKLHEAVRYGDVNLVESALVDGLDPNTLGLYEWGPMHEAASNGDLEILRLLLQYNGDPNTKDHLHSSTAVHYACKEGHVDCLEALLGMGGRYDIANSNGETGIDVAIGKCKVLLNKHSTQRLIQDAVQEKLIERDDEDKLTEDKHPEINDKGSELDLNGSEDRLSSSSSLSDLPIAWESIEVTETNEVPQKDAGTGMLQLSFEYNSHTSIMKIRVWQLEDVLLPPAEIASISRISIRSRLLPDKKGDTKRKTEETKLEDLEKMKMSIVNVRRKTAKDSFKALYLPCFFRFTRPLEYKNITKDLVASKTVHIEVNVKQKYSTKSFAVANVQIPLKEAVRRLRKKSYKLHPCINFSMPDNIHSYDPSDLIIVSEGMYSNRTVSNPNLRANSNLSLRVEAGQRASSDINLQTVRCHSADSIPSISLSIPDDGQEEDALSAIAVMNDAPKSVQLSRSNPEIHVVEMHEMDNILPGTTDTDLREVKVEAPLHKLSRSTPNIPALHIEDLDSEDAPKRLNRPTSPANRLTVPSVTYNRRHQDSSTKPKRQLPDLSKLKKVSDKADHMLNDNDKQPRPGRAVPVPDTSKAVSSFVVDGKIQSFSNSPVTPDLSDQFQSRLQEKKDAVKSKVKEKRNQRVKGHHGLLRTFSEKEDTFSPGFGNDERNVKHPEHELVSNLGGGLLSKVEMAPGEKRAAKESNILKMKSKTKDEHFGNVIPMSDLTSDSRTIPKIAAISETQFGQISPLKQLTPKKTTSTCETDPLSHSRLKLVSDGSRGLLANQVFPMPITHGLLHTDLSRPTRPKAELASSEHETMPRSPSPGSEARVHFLSETERPNRNLKYPTSTQKKRSPKTVVDSPAKSITTSPSARSDARDHFSSETESQNFGCEQTSQNRRIRSPVHKPELQPPETCRSKTRLSSPGSGTKVQFLSETQTLDSSYRRTSPARRIRSPVRRPENIISKNKEVGKSEIEMSTLHIDSEFNKITSSESKLQVFQETNNAPHPPGFHMKPESSKTGHSHYVERVNDPFSVPENPTGSETDSTQSSRIQGRAVYHSTHVDKSLASKQGVIADQTVIRVKQSIL